MLRHSLKSNHKLHTNHQQVYFRNVCAGTSLTIRCLRLRAPKGRAPGLLPVSCCCLVTKSSLALCDPMDCSRSGVPV